MYFNFINGHKSTFDVQITWAQKYLRRLLNEEKIFDKKADEIDAFKNKHFSKLTCREVTDVYREY